MTMTSGNVCKAGPTLFVSAPGNTYSTVRTTVNSILYIQESRM